MMAKLRECQVTDKLIKRGKKLFVKANRIENRQHFFTSNTQAGEFIEQIDKYPHAFLLGCLADMQVKADVAWNIPFALYKKLGTFKFKILHDLSKEKWMELMSSPKPLHRFPKRIGESFFNGIQRVKSEYSGNAANIWNKNLSSSEIVYRFLCFDGIGQKIATMATNILACFFQVSMSDHYSVDISVDRHIKKVFKRLGLVSPEAEESQIVFKARAINPEYPGLLDLPAFEIGRNWCKPIDPRCNECYMVDCCKYSHNELD